MVCTTRMESTEESESERTLPGERKQLVFLEIERDVRLFARRGVQNDRDFLVIGDGERAHADQRREQRQGAQLEHVDGGLAASLLQNGEIFLAGGRSGVRHPANLVDFLGLREESVGQTPTWKPQTNRTGGECPTQRPRFRRPCRRRPKRLCGERKRKGTGVLRVPADVFDFEFGANAFGTVVLLAWEMRKRIVEIAELVRGGEEEQDGFVGGACGHDIGLVWIVVNGGDGARGLVAVNVVQRGGGHIEKLEKMEKKERAYFDGLIVVDAAEMIGMEGIELDEGNAR